MKRDPPKLPHPAVGEADVTDPGHLTFVQPLCLQLLGEAAALQQTDRLTRSGQIQGQGDAGGAGPHDADVRLQPCALFQLYGVYDQRSLLVSSRGPLTARAHLISNSGALVLT